MQAPELDPRIAEYILDSQAADLFRITRRFKAQGHKSDFMAKVAEDEDLVAAYLFKPRSQVLELDNLPEAFREQLKPFNVIGFVRQGDGKLTLDLLGGLARPFTTLKNPVEMRRTLYAESVIGFTNHLLRCRGLEKDVNEYGFEEFKDEMLAQSKQAAALRSGGQDFGPAGPFGAGGPFGG